MYLTALEKRGDVSPTVAEARIYKILSFLWTPLDIIKPLRSQPES